MYSSSCLKKGQIANELWEWTVYCLTQNLTSEDSERPSQPNGIIQHFQLQHLLMTGDIKEPEDAAINLNLLGRLGHNSIGKEHCIS